MFRDGNTINLTNGDGGNHTISVIRPLKASEKAKEIRSRIATRKFLSTDKTLTAKEKNKATEIHRYPGLAEREAGIRRNSPGWFFLPW